MTLHNNSLAILKSFTIKLSDEGSMRAANTPHKMNVTTNESKRINSLWFAFATVNSLNKLCKFRSFRLIFACQDRVKKKETMKCRLDINEILARIWIMIIIFIKS